MEFLEYENLTNWRQKYLDSNSQETTPKTPKSLVADKSATARFVQLVRIIGICERGLYLDDDIILAELDADDLAELTTLEVWDRRNWAGLLAHRLCDIREGKRPPRPGQAEGKRRAGTASK